jgi:bifunctional non-homologous end joining protein LigD
MIDDLGNSEFPEWIEPMAATLTQERFIGADWTFERKFDGIRLIAFKQGEAVRLYSRTRKEKDLPGIAAAIASLPVADVILDGEVTWDGRTAYHVFDIVWIDGCDATSQPLAERRRLLATLPLAPPLHLVRELNDPAPWDRACREGWEGVIAKRRDSPYEHKRSKYWLKMKCELAQNFVVGGFTDAQGSRIGLGALLVGYFDGDDFVFAGKVGTGFDTKLLTELRARFDAMEIAKAPFTRGKGLPRVRAHWVRPEIVVHVAFIEWTVHMKLRHSRLLGVRTDVAPRDVRGPTADA